MTEGVTGLLVYIALKLFGYSGWSWAGLAWLGNGGRVGGAFTRGVGRLLIGWATGLAVAPLAFVAAGTGHVTLFYVLALPVVRWLEWGIIQVTLGPDRQGAAFVHGLSTRGRLWRAGGVVVSYLADLPFLVAAGGLPQGRIFC
jgi:hypothetical protein